jgi:methionyl-tRNA formyltransferase
MKKKRIIIATIKQWNIDNAINFINKFNNFEFLLITKKSDLTQNKIKKFGPDFIFFPHWSWIIPRNIFNNFQCIVFHMTDLPYGRGGTPLQNLLIRNRKKTKISAIKVIEEVDAGPIYLKKDLELTGNAEIIYKKASKIIFDNMIPEIIVNNLLPKKQVGKPIIFKRRNPKESDIKNAVRVKEIYNKIRMVDAEGYPPAYISTKNFIVTFKKAELTEKKVIAIAEFKIKKNEK